MCNITSANRWHAVTVGCVFFFKKSWPFWMENVPTKRNAFILLRASVHSIPFPGLLLGSYFFKTLFKIEKSRSKEMCALYVTFSMHAKNSCNHQAEPVHFGAYFCSRLILVVALHLQNTCACKGLPCHPSCSPTPLLYFLLISFWELLSLR